jgi:tetratricopeptide (TPR) repeat protein
MTRAILSLLAAALAAGAVYAQEKAFPYVEVAKEFLAAYRQKNSVAQLIQAGRPAREVEYTLAVQLLLMKGEFDAATALAEARGDAGGPEGAGLRLLAATFKRGMRPTRDQLASWSVAEKLIARNPAAALSALEGAGRPVERTTLGVRILWTRARAHLQLGGPREAEPLFARCAQFARTIGWLARERDALRYSLKVAKPGSERALEAADDLVRCARDLDDGNLRLTALARRAEIRLMRGMAREGRKDYAAAIELAKRLGKRFEAAQLLGKLAMVFQLREGQPRQALRLQEQSLQILKELLPGGAPEVRKWYRQSLFNTATLRAQIVRYSDALANLDELLAAQDPLPAELLGRALAQRAYVLMRMGRVEKSLAAYHEALAVAKTKDHRVSLRSHLGELQLLRADLRAAEECFAAILSEAPQHARALAGRATVRGTRGDEEGAIRDFERAEETAGYASEKAKVLLQRAAVERSWGRVADARRSTGRSLDLFIESDKDLDPAKRDFTNTAVAYVVRGDLRLLDHLYEEAVQPLAEGAVFFFRLDDPVRAIPAYVRWMLVLVALEKWNPALERLQVLQRMARSTPGDSLKSAAKGAEGWFEAKAGRIDGALEHLRQARDLAAKAHDPEREATALVHLALLEPQKGLSLVERALELMDSRRVDAPGRQPFVEGERPDFAASVGVRTLLQTADMPPEKRAAKAFEFIERERVRRLQLALRGRTAILEATLDAELHAAYIAARGRLKEARAEKTGVAEAESAFDSMVDLLHEKAPAAAALAFPRAPALNRVQAALAEDEALVLMLDDVYVRALVAVTRETARLSEFEVEQPLEGVAGLLEGKKKLIVVPDGLLLLENIAWGDQRRLFDAFEIFYLNSADTFLRLRSLGPPVGKGVAVLGKGPKRLGAPLSPETRMRLLHEGRPVRLNLTHPPASTRDLRTRWNADTVVLADAELLKGRKPLVEGVGCAVEALFLGGTRRVVLSLAGAPPAEFWDHFYADCLDKGMSAPLALRDARTWLRGQPGESPLWTGLVCYGVP